MYIGRSPSRPQRSISHISGNRIAHWHLYRRPPRVGRVGEINERVWVSAESVAYIQQSTPLVFYNRRLGEALPVIQGKEPASAFTPQPGAELAFIDIYPGRGMFLRYIH